jgi:hypothetical protein
MLHEVGSEREILTTSNSWRDLYAAAMLELDRDRLPGKIQEAQTAINSALDQFMTGGLLCDPPERQVMADALRNLQVLQRLEFVSTKLESSPEQRGEEKEGL